MRRGGARRVWWDRGGARCKSCGRVDGGAWHQVIKRSRGRRLTPGHGSACGCRVSWCVRGKEWVVGARPRYLQTVVQRFVCVLRVCGPREPKGPGRAQTRLVGRASCEVAARVRAVHQQGRRIQRAATCRAASCGLASGAAAECGIEYDVSRSGEGPCARVGRPSDRIIYICSHYRASWCRADAPTNDTKIPNGKLPMPHASIADALRRGPIGYIKRSAGRRAAPPPA